MKIKNLIRICLLFSLFAVNAQAQTANPMAGCGDLAVQFTAGMNLNSYFWDFGDSANSTETNPQHIYTTPGIYTVNLSETNGGPVLGTVTVTVYKDPVFSISASPASGCAPLPVDFTNNTILDPLMPFNSFEWTFGDGSSITSTGLSGVSHTYNTTGVFNVGIKLNTDFPSCNFTEFFGGLVNVSTIPNLGFVTNPSPPVSCTAPLTVSFVNTTPSAGLYTFLWDFGNGATSTAVNPPNQTYTTEGIYTVVLNATDANGCIDSYSINIQVGPPLTDFTLPFDTICITDIITLNNTSSPGQYLWTFGSGASPANSNQVNPLVQFNQGGLIPITLMVTANGCSGTVTKNIFVDDPDASFTSNPSYSCTKTLTTTFTPNSTTAASYFWLFNDGTTSTSQSPTHTIVNMDTTIYSINGQILDSTYLTVTNPSGCQATFLLVDTLYKPNALYAPDVAHGCFPLDVTFEDLSTNDYDIIRWEWDYGDGSPVETYTTSTDPSHTYTAPGEYPVELTITDEIGCKDTSYVFIIEVGATLAPDFTTTDPTSICPGDSVTFTPTNFPDADKVDAWHFETDGTRSFHCFQEDVLTWTFASETGDYDATLYVEYNGCISEITKTDLVTVKGPIAQIDYLIDCATPFDVSFRDSSDEATSILWTFGDLTDTTQSDVIHTYPDTGDYKVYLMAENATSGCPASLDSAIIHIRDIYAEAVLLDTQLCLGNMYMLDASPSLNVDTRCWRGFTWYFSDPNDRPITTKDTMVEHVFESPGYNDVTLVTRDINGCLDTFTQTVDVFGVYPAISVDDDVICLGQLVNFIDLSTADTTLVEWEWTFSDGGMETTQNTSHIFTSGLDSTVTATLTLTDELGCGGELVTTLRLYTPTSTITALPRTNICVGDQIDFAASDYTDQGSFLNFAWDFGNSQTSTNQSETITYNTSGDYLVILEYVEDATGCKDQKTVDVSVQDYPNALIGTNVDINDVICNSEQIRFSFDGTTTSPISSYLWDFDGAAPNSDLATPILTFPNGQYEVIMTVATSNGCSDMDTVNIQIVGPQGLLSLDRDAICLGESITFSLSDLEDVGSFTWDFGDGSSQNGGNPTTHVYNTIPSLDTVRVILFGATSTCDFTIEEPFSVLDVGATIADIDPDPGCTGNLISFIASSLLNSTYAWNFGDSGTGVGANPTHTYSDAGDYDIQLIATEGSLGCKDTIVQNLVISASPEVEIDGDVICNGKETTINLLNPNDDYSYSWAPADIFNDAMVTSPVTRDDINFQNSTIISVTATNSAGCETTTEQIFNIVNRLTVIPFDTTTCPGQMIVLSVIGKQDYHILNWTGGDVATLSCTDCNNPVATVPDGGISYILNVADELECFNYEPYVFNISTPDGDFKMPNAFTPGEPENNFFRPVPKEGVAIEDLEITRFEIFNRWGQKVYDNDNPTQGWDGTRNGKPSASDVYLYLIETNFAGCAGQMFQGNVTLVR